MVINFLYILFLYVINLSLESNINNKYKLNIPFTFDISNKSFEDALHLDDDQLKELLKLFLKSIDDYPEDAKMILSNEEILNSAKKGFKDYLEEQGFKDIDYFVNDIFNITNIISFIDIVQKNKEDKDAVNIIEQLLSLIDTLDDKNNLEMNSLIKIFGNILNCKQLEDFIKTFRNYKSIFYNITINFLEKSDLGEFVIKLKPFLDKYISQLFDLLYNLIKYYSNKNNSLSVDTIYNFIQNNTNFINEFREQFENSDILRAFAKSFYSEDPLLNELKDAIFNDTDFIFILLDFSQNKKVIEVIYNFIKEFIQSEKNKSYKNLMDYTSKLIDKIVSINGSYYQIMLNIQARAIKRIYNQKTFIEYISNNYMNQVKKFLGGFSLLKFNGSKDCIYLMNSIFFDEIKNISSLRIFYLGKFLIHSTKNKNDFLTYENCLKEKKFEKIDGLNFTVDPFYVIGIIEDKESKKKLNGSMLSEKYNYLIKLLK